MGVVIDGRFQVRSLQRLDDGRVAITGTFDGPSERVLSYLGGLSVHPELTAEEMMQAREHCVSARRHLDGAHELLAEMAKQAGISVDEARRRMLAMSGIVRVVE